MKSCKDVKKIWKHEQLNRNVFRISIDIAKNKNWEWWMLLTSDQHWDNPGSNHEMQIRHLKEARERGAAVMSAGDFFCLMQGKWDKRSSKNSIRPEHNNDRYLDSVIDTAVDFFKPFADMFVCIATGNHEQSIADRYETSMIDRFCGAINREAKSKIHNGGFSGWIIFQFVEKLNNSSRSNSNRTVLHYDHGYAGGGAVTADMIQHQRRSVYLPDADIILSGHTHDQWCREVARLRLTSNGAIRHDIQTHIKIPSYKEEYKDGYKGWHATKGLPPKPIGAYWLRFFYDHAAGRVLYETIKAQ